MNPDMNDPDIESPGIYVHVPFCRTRCAYCDFYSVAEPGAALGEDGVAGRFASALERETRMRSGEIAGPAGSLYVGGGTPSALDPALAAGIPPAVSRPFGLEKGAEITIEVNPDDVTPRALDAYLEGGFNRVSIGAQSFEDGELAFLDRRHDADAASASVEAAREAGFAGVGIDLIFGLAGQTVESWEGNLRRAVELEPDHVSCYQLTIERGTPLGGRAAAGEVVCVPEELQREMFLQASRVLTAAGFIHYEVSNFARGEGKRSRHNMRYWLRRPYLGLGPSAHSFDGRARSWNDGSLDGWLEALEKGERPPGGSEEIAPDQARAERLMLGFRTLFGVEKALLAEHPGWEETLEELLEMHLVILEGERVVPTVEGFLVADRLPLLFM